MVSVDDEGSTGSKQIELANACFSKGRKFWGNGNHEEALSMFRKALAIYEFLGKDKNMAKTYYWIGFALKNRKEFDKALVAYRRSLRLRISLKGGVDNNDVSTEDTKRALHDTLVENKSFAGDDEDTTTSTPTNENKIEEYFKQLAESAKQEDLGNTLSKQGNYSKAVEAYMRCLSIEENALGRFPLDIARIYSKIGEIHIKEEEPEMAITAYREALYVYESTLGKTHPDSISCIDGIESAAYKKGLEQIEVNEYCRSVYKSIWHTKQGDTLQISGQYEKAIAEYQAAVDIEESFLGKYALSAAGIYRRMATTFSSMKKYDHAILVLRTVLTIHIFECGSDHPTVLTALKDISQAMKEKGFNNSDINKYLNTVSYSVKYERYGEHIRKDGEYSEALEEFQKALALEQSALGKYHLTQASLFRSIGNAFNGLGKYNHAIVNYRQALTIYLSNLGEKHFDTTNTLKRLSYAAEDKGMTDEEIDAYKDATCKSIALERTGDELSAEGIDPKNAEKITSAYLRAIDLEVASLGPFNLCTAALHNKVATTLKEAKFYDRAIVKFRDVLAIYDTALGQEHPNTQKAKEEIKLVAIMKGMDEGKAVAYSLSAIESIRCEREGDEKRRSGLYDKAAVDYNRGIALEEEALGVSHLSTASLRQKLADIYRLKGQFNRTVLLNRKVARIYHDNAVPKRSDGSATTQSLELAFQGLGFNVSHSGKYFQAVSESVRCEASGDAALRTGNYHAALSEYRRAVSIEESLLGKLPLTTAALYHKMGSICRDRNDFQSAIILYSKALAIQEAHLGKESAETIRTYNDLLNVTQKEAAVTKSHLEGWTTLNYILMGLIGLLVLIATVVKSVSARQTSVKQLDLSSLEDDIGDENDFLQSSKAATGKDPDGANKSPTSVTARPRRQSLDPPQWGHGGEPDAPKFVNSTMHEPLAEIPERRQSNDFRAQMFNGGSEFGEAVKCAEPSAGEALNRSTENKERSERIEEARRERRQSNDFHALKFEGGTKVEENEEIDSQLSSGAVLSSDLVRRFKNIQSEREGKTIDRGSENPTNQSTAEPPPLTGDNVAEVSQEEPGPTEPQTLKEGHQLDTNEVKGTLETRDIRERQDVVPYPNLFSLTGDKPQILESSNIGGIAPGNTDDLRPENVGTGDKATQLQSDSNIELLNGDDPSDSKPAFAAEKQRDDLKSPRTFADKLEFARQESRRHLAPQIPPPSPVDGALDSRKDDGL